MNILAANPIPTVAIIGRTNVGKSTLFNALLGRRLSIVEDEPGVTRDRHYALISRGNRPYTIIDTGGVAGDETSLESAVRAQAEVAIKEADVIVALFDGLAGVHPHDEIVVELMRRCAKPVIWVINKCEKEDTRLATGDFYALGIDQPLVISAAHRIGVRELGQKIEELLPPLVIDAEPLERPAKPIRIAIIGRPNVGKSSLVNRLLGEDRLVVSEIAGTTRDAVDSRLTWHGHEFSLIDTAGLRKRARIDAGTVERFSNLRTLRALIMSDVAVLVLDATAGVPGEQDAKIAGLVHERGRALVIVINKWDAIEKNHRSVQEYRQAVRTAFKFAPYAPIIFLSALTGRRCGGLLSEVLKVYENSTSRIKTGELNRVITRAFLQKPPPVVRGEPIKLYFATQIGVAPPIIVLFVNHPNKVNFSYQRYIKNQIREHFPFEGADIKLVFRKRTDKQEDAGAAR